MHNLNVRITIPDEYKEWVELLADHIQQVICELPFQSEYRHDFYDPETSYGFDSRRVPVRQRSRYVEPEEVKPIAAPPPQINETELFLQRNLCMTPDEAEKIMSILETGNGMKAHDYLTSLENDDFIDEEEMEL